MILLLTTFFLIKLNAFLIIKYLILFLTTFLN